MQNDLANRLAALREPVRIGIVGIGSIGKGLVFQAHLTPGIHCVAIADLHIERAIACAQALGREYRVVDRVDALNDALARGWLAVCEDAGLVAQCDAVDVFVDSSNAIAAAARFCVIALERRKHLVMMNAEADLIFGPDLRRRARENGVVYSSCNGDQPVVVKQLIDEMRFWGFDLVMAGNVKGFLDRYSNPTKIVPEADKRGLDYKMATSYTDGTKLNIEMALVANALGLQTSIPGMQGPHAAHVRDVLTKFDLPALWKNKQGVVDYVLGAEPKGGVFAIGYTENALQRSTLAWYPMEMGAGPFYVFYRPYHLGFIEAMSTIGAAALDGRSLLEPTFGLQTNVYAYAKRDLQIGETLDHIGGYACYGLVENCEGERDPGLPICLASEMTLRRNIAQNEKILWSDVVYDASRADIALYRSAAAHSKRVNE